MVTGHRRIHHSTLVVERLLNVIDRLGPSRAISGGAAGADTLFAGAAITAGVPLEIMLPNRWYTKRYPSAVNAAILSAASGVTVDNVDLQLQHVDFALVASSVSLNNTDLNPSAVAELAARFAARRSSR